MLLTKPMKVSSIAEHACPDTHSAMTAASKTSPEQQGALSSIIQPTCDMQSCGGETASPGAWGKSPASPQQAELELCAQTLQLS